MTDSELLIQFKNLATREQAFGIILKNYQEKIYWQVRRIIKDHESANDVVQNVWIKVWHHLEKFNGESLLSTWLYRIAYNESITYITQQKKQNLSDWKNEVAVLSDSKIYDESKNEFNEMVLNAIETLPEKQKIVFKMRYFDEIPYEEMSKIMDTSVGALKASYHHATKKIESFIKDNLNQN